MIVSDLPHDVLFAIAMAAGVLRDVSRKLDTPTTPTIHVMASVSRAWRSAVFSRLCQDLRVRSGREMGCAEFLKTSSGKAVASHVRSIRFDNSELATLLPPLLDILRRLPHLRRLRLQISSSYDLSHDTTAQYFPSGYPSERFSLDTVALFLPDLRTSQAYLNLTAIINVFSHIDSLDLRLSCPLNWRSWSSSRINTLLKQLLKILDSSFLPPINILDRINTFFADNFVQHPLPDYMSGFSSSFFLNYWNDLLYILAIILCIFIIKFLDLVTKKLPRVNKVVLIALGRLRWNYLLLTIGDQLC